MADTVKTRLAEIQAPYGRRIALDNVAYESGMELMRLTIREGSRYTIFEIDATTAKTWGEALCAWAQRQPDAAPEPAAGGETRNGEP